MLLLMGGGVVCCDCCCGVFCFECYGECAGCGYIVFDVRCYCGVFLVELVFGG